MKGRGRKTDGAHAAAAPKRRAVAPAKRVRVAVVTGTRAEFGLLVPVMRAIRRHPRLKLQVVAAGAHFLGPARTIREVEAAFPVAARVPMQRAGRATRADDAAAAARGIAGFNRAFAKLKPDWVVVLGDRIEAFAAASAASIAGVAVAHIHGGDRAEGIADEAMRHAITKLAHLHLAATKQSAERINKLGEKREHVHVVGSPAIDGLDAIPPMDNRGYRALGEPRAVLLLHPSGLPPDEERRLADTVVKAIVGSCASGVLVLSPNHDPGREIVAKAIKELFPGWTHCDHLPRVQFLGLLKRLAIQHIRGLLIGNSSAGLIEAAALRLPVVNIGPRQAGRERGDNVIDIEQVVAQRISDAIARSLSRTWPSEVHPYGDGRAGERIANLVASIDPHSPLLLRKRNAY